MRRDETCSLGRMRGKASTEPSAAALSSEAAETLAAGVPLKRCAKASLSTRLESANLALSSVISWSPPPAGASATTSCG